MSHDNFSDANWDCIELIMRRHYEDEILDVIDNMLCDQYSVNYAYKTLGEISLRENKGMTALGELMDVILELNIKKMLMNIPPTPKKPFYIPPAPTKPPLPQEDPA